MEVEVTGLGETIRHAEQDGTATLLGRAERLRAIKEQLGFYPQSNEEAARASNLMGREGQFSPVLAHLDEIYRHQRKAGADAPRALRSVVRTFQDYAGNALNEQRYMEAFSEKMSEAEPSSLTGFNTLFPVESWQNDGTAKAMLTSLSRFIETSTFAETEKSDRLGKRQLIDYTTGEERVARITDTLGNLRASNLQRIASAVHVNQENRFEFWINQLEASRRHLFVREIAGVALKELREAHSNE